MSKYPEQYRSESKGAVDIESMATPHIANAWRKLGGTYIGPDAHDVALRAFMWDELVERGCTYDRETGTWTFPDPKEATP